MERNVPHDLWLYDDRCMKKWQRWILSDHSKRIPLICYTWLQAAEVHFLFIS
jgi:hypothetical protein